MYEMSMLHAISLDVATHLKRLSEQRERGQGGTEGKRGGGVDSGL